MEPDALRAGGLKNCYESRTPAIIVITDGKERIWNEKTGRCSFRTVLYRARHAPMAYGACRSVRAAQSGSYCLELITAACDEPRAMELSLIHI